MLRRNELVPTLSSCSSYRNITSAMLVPETHQMRFDNGPEPAFANRDKLSDEDFVNTSNHQWPNLDKLDHCHLVSDVARCYPPASLGDGLSGTGANDESSNNFEIWPRSAANQQHIKAESARGGGSKKEEDVSKLSAFASFCQGCKKLIEDRYLLNIGGLCWHEDCAKCTTCFSRLTTSCFFNDGHLYCREDYQRTRKKCAGCSNQIEKDEMVMRVNNSLYVYHVACFACSVCKRLLRKGDEFIHNNFSGNAKCLELQCKSCWGRCNEKSEPAVDQSLADEEKAVITNNLSPGRSSDVTDCILSPKSMLCAVSPSKSDDDEGMSSDDDSTSGQLNSSKEEQGECEKRSLDADEKDGKRSKRPRTILNAVQRRAFKAAFEITPKPCRKVRETLAKDTGLTVRVVQVWFQNQRAKMKKLAKRQQSQEAAAQKAREEFAFHAFDPMNPMMHHHLPQLMRDGKHMMDSYGYMHVNQPAAMPFTQMQNEQQQIAFTPGNFCDHTPYYDAVNVTSPTRGECVTVPQMLGCNPSIGHLSQTTSNPFPSNMLQPNAIGRDLPTSDTDVMSVSPMRHSSGVVTPIDSLYTMQNNYFNS